jgi:hypothetical protein
MVLIVEACKKNMFKCHILFPATLISICNILPPIVRRRKLEQEGKKTEMLWMGQGKDVSFIFVVRNWS